MGGENVDDCDEIMMQWIDHTSEIQTWTSVIYGSSCQCSVDIK